MSFVMSLEVTKLADLIAKAFEKELEDKLWEKWLAILPNMDEKNAISFSDYKDKHFSEGKSSLIERTDEQILEDAKQILNMMNKS